MVVRVVLVVVPWNEKEMLLSWIRMTMTTMMTMMTMMTVMIVERRKDDTDNDDG